MLTKFGRNKPVWGVGNRDAIKLSSVAETLPSPRSRMPWLVTEKTFSSRTPCNNAKSTDESSRVAHWNMLSRCMHVRPIYCKRHIARWRRPSIWRAESWIVLPYDIFLTKYAPFRTSVMHQTKCLDLDNYRYLDAETVHVVNLRNKCVYKSTSCARTVAWTSTPMSFFFFVCAWLTTLISCLHFY